MSVGKFHRGHSDCATIGRKEACFQGRDRFRRVPGSSGNHCYQAYAVTLTACALPQRGRNARRSRAQRHRCPERMLGEIRKNWPKAVPNSAGRNRGGAKTPARGQGHMYVAGSRNARRNWAQSRKAQSMCTTQTKTLILVWYATEQHGAQIRQHETHVSTS